MKQLTHNVQAPSTKLVDAASVHSLFRILAVVFILQLVFGVYYYVSYNEAVKTNAFTTAMLEKALETNGQLLASNNMLKANLSVAEVKLSKALIPESNFSDAFETHITKPVTEKANQTVSYTKDKFNSAYNYVFN